VDLERLGKVKYTLTRYFAANGLIERYRRLAKVDRLVRTAARTGYKAYTGGSKEQYLLDYFDWLGIALKDPTLEPGLPSESWLMAVERANEGKNEEWTRERYPISSRLWQRIRYLSHVENGYRCQCCGATSGVMDVSLHVDHIKPRSRYPELTFDVDNTQILCRSCNARKGTKETDYRRIQ
jgi:5-methylcytosine-specific restriction endonuclease McrA